MSLEQLKICGTHAHSILDISRTLSSIGWAHLIHSAPTETTKRMLLRVGQGKVKVLVANGLRSIRERKGMIIVVDSASALANANLPPIPSDRDLKTALLGFPQLWRTDVVIKKTKIMDIVNQASKPSFLTEVQTAIYKVSSHPLRKKAQAAIVAYLNSRLSMRGLREVLNSSLHLEPLLPMMIGDNAVALRAAVERFNRGEDIKVIEKETKCSSFDIMYVTRSYSKSNPEEIK